MERAELLRVRDAMVARGPDDAGLWISPDGRVGLALRRLAIIDLSKAGAQPMASGDGALRIVFNGEIYNYRALRESLRQHGHVFVSGSDTEVLLHLYARYGHEMVDHLRGMYAFGIWDEARRGLFLARDPFGIKPLYYADGGGTVRIASQVKALLKSDHVGDGADPAGHVGFFLWGHVPDPYTLYGDIRALPAGARLWIDRHGVRAPERFFSVRETLIAAEARPAEGGDADRDGRMRAALLDSVRHHLVADVPVGVFLSSGLDSTTVTAYASELHGAELETITLGFEEYRGTHDDEVPLAETVAVACGTSHRTRWVRAGEFKDDQAAVLAAMDQPTIDGVNAYFVSKAAKESGLKVALSGLGGDEMFGGYPSFDQIPRLVRALAPAHSIPALGRAFRWVSAPLLRHFTSPKYASILEYGTSHGDAYLLRRGLFMPWELPRLLDPELVREGWAELRTLLRLGETLKGLRGSHFRIAALELCWYMRDRLLRDADWAGMAHSLEIRVPLVDIDLLREMAPLLASARRPTKRDMARSPPTALPDAVLSRSKTGFSVPVQEWLQQGSSDTARTRGLRGWARKVHETCYAD